jgi:hypothetical protein
MVEHFAHGPQGDSRRHGVKVLRVFGLVLAGAGVAVLFAALFGWLVQILWNWLMPAVFGLKTITFGQGFGILLLAKLLFGGVAPGHRRHHERWGRRFRERVHGVEPGEEPGPDGAPMPGNGRRWHQFRGYWQDEGRAAFEAYVQKTKPQDEK